VLFGLLFAAVPATAVQKEGPGLAALPVLDRYFQEGTLLTELEEEEIDRGVYFRIVDGEGGLITITGRRIRPGDRYLDAGNRLYEVFKVRGYTAIARYIRTEELSPPARPGEALSLDAAKPGFQAFDFGGAGLPGKWPFPLERVQQEGELQEGEEDRRLVAIYHTHNAESYVPTDGTHSIYGRGGIHEVGVAFSEALQEKNIDVIHAQNLHLPHDRGAYRRSRNTVLELLDKNPDVIFDVHRDAAPWDVYAVPVDDQWVAGVQFVVGRQNPSFVVTRRFAYDLKGLADRVYPGLVRGVLLGWGNYNQDLTPLKLLLEVGSHQNTREAAEDGAVLFADVVALYFYGIPVENGESYTPAGEADGDVEGAAGRTIAAAVLLALGGAAGFYFLNNPAAWKRFKEHIRSYPGREGAFWAAARHNIVEGLAKLRKALLFLKNK